MLLDDRFEDLIDSLGGIAGVQLDVIDEGRRLVPRETFSGWFEAAGAGTPAVIDLPSGATMFVAERSAS